MNEVGAGWSSECTGEPPLNGSALVVGSVRNRDILEFGLAGVV